MVEQEKSVGHLPKFLVIGAEKSGTTWLYQALSSHPGIFLPDTKEIHFFNSHNSLLKPVTHFELGLDWYRRFFKSASADQLCGEVTPMYLADPVAADRIASTLPHAKLIYILRDPAARAYSHYWMARRKGLVSQDFPEVVANNDRRFIERGYYSQQLAKYYEQFPSHQLLGFDYDDFFKNKKQSLQKVLTFLGVSADDELVDGILTQSQGLIGGARTPRSVWAHQMISRVSKSLRNSHTGSRLMDLIKQTKVSRLKDMNFRSEPYQPISEQDWIALKKIYREDILKLEDMVSFPVRKWLEVQ